MKYKLKSGETLIEVIIAVSVLMIVMSPLSAMFVNSIRNTAGNRDALIAAGLANEGVELIRNIRDMNLLRFSAKNGDCAFASINNPAVTIDNCDQPGNAIEAGTSTIDLDPSSLDVRLTKQNTIFDTTNPQEIYSLKLNDTPPIYNHTNGTSTNFFREIGITYSSDSEVMSVASNVYFRNGNKLIKIPRNILLTKKS